MFVDDNRKSYGRLHKNKSITFDKIFFQLKIEIDGQFKIVALKLGFFVSATIQQFSISKEASKIQCIFYIVKTINVI